VKVNSGNDFQACAMGGNRAGEANTATSTTATSLTRTGATWTTDQWIGHLVQAGTVYGVVLSNTATVLTVDRWYNPATPGGAAGSTPSGTSAYMILPGAAPAWYMAITANSSAAAAGDTTLTGEITTAGGGLIRQIATYAHTTGANTYTLTGTYVANGSDTLPVTVAKMGTFNSIVSGRMVHETLLSATATLSAVSDQLTVTQTVTT
jgi:hypothetical protein